LLERREGGREGGREKGRGGEELRSTDTCSYLKKEATDEKIVEAAATAAAATFDSSLLPRGQKSALLQK